MHLKNHSDQSEAASYTEPSPISISLCFRPIKELWVMSTVLDQDSLITCCVLENNNSKTYSDPSIMRNIGFFPLSLACNPVNQIIVKVLYFLDPEDIGMSSGNNERLAATYLLDRNNPSILTWRQVTIFLYTSITA